jgi:D-alanyl-lipoteichoic acid acyltransferase DltB (MBOAT superfamily)
MKPSKVLINFWGLVKKADTCATYANAILTTIQHEFLVFTPRSVYFAFQIYGDFSGYSDMALRNNCSGWI